MSRRDPDKHVVNVCSNHHERDGPNEGNTSVDQPITNNDGQVLKLVIKILDTSVIDSSAIIISENLFLIENYFPVSLKIKYEEGEINVRNKYSIFAEIYMTSSDGSQQRKYITTQEYPVFSKQQLANITLTKIN